MHPTSHTLTTPPPFPWVIHPTETCKHYSHDHDHLKEKHLYIDSFKSSSGISFFHSFILLSFFLWLHDLILSFNRCIAIFKSILLIVIIFDDCNAFVEWETLIDRFSSFSFFLSFILSVNSTQFNSTILIEFTSITIIFVITIRIILIDRFSSFESHDPSHSIESLLSSSSPFPFFFPLPLLLSFFFLSSFFFFLLQVIF